MVKTCGHEQVVILEPNSRVNSSRLAEQRDIRKSGETFKMNLQHTCCCCGEFVEVQKTIKRK